MQKRIKSKLCERCQLPIEANDPHIQYTLTGQTHTANRCVEILKQKIHQLEKKNAKS